MKGFTLIEVLVVMTITVIMTGILIQNYASIRTNLGQERLLVQDAIREAQSLALSGAQFKDLYRCGFGIHFETTSYTVYAGGDASSDCSAQRKYYFEGSTDIVRTGYVSNNVVEISAGGDIFFEPPNPTTYLCTGTSCVSVPDRTSTIVIHRKNVSCTGTTATADCRSITVSSSGTITPN